MCGFIQVEANARVVAGAEAYYRNMFSKDDITWNIRDSHFMDTVTLVERHVKDMRARALEAAAKEGRCGMAVTLLHLDSACLWTILHLVVRLGRL